MSIDQDNSQAAPCLLEQARRAAGRGGLQEALDLLRLARSDAEVLRLRGLVLMRLGKVEEAVADLEQAAGEMAGCGACQHELGVARLRAGQLEGAREALARCVSLQPDNARARDTLAGALLRLGRRSEALEAVSSAIVLEPDNTGYLHNRAVVLTTLDRKEEAIRDYERVLILAPASAGTQNNLAWLLVTAPDPSLRDGSRALELARRAVASGRTGAWLDTLAAAQAECGDFEAAVRTETEALERTSPPIPDFRERIVAYRAGRTLAQLQGSARS